MSDARSSAAAASRVVVGRSRAWRTGSSAGAAASAAASSAALNVSERVGDEADLGRRELARRPPCVARSARRPHAAGARHPRGAGRDGRAAGRRGRRHAHRPSPASAWPCSPPTACRCSPSRPGERRWPCTPAGAARWPASASRAAAGRARAFGIAPSEWRVALGPSIGGCCYEVEADIGRQFVDRWGAMPDAWQPAGDARTARSAPRQSGHPGCQRGGRRCRSSTSAPAPAAPTSDFFSHRRSQGRAGRQLSVIGLSGPGRPAGR